MDNVHLLTHIQQQGRRIKIAFALQRLAAQRHSRPLRHRLRHFARHLVPRRGVDQRPHRDVVPRRRIAKLHGLHRLAETVNEAVVNALLDIDPLDAVTHLPGINHPRVHYRFHRQLQIRIVHHNGWRFAAEFEAHFSDIFCRGGHDFLPCRHAAGHADHRHLRITGQLLTNGFSAAEHQVKDPFRQPNLMDNLGKGDGIIGRKFAGLNDDGIPGDQGRGQLAGDKKEREVPRQDPGSHPQRAFKDEDILPRAIALHDLTFVTARPFCHIVEIVRGERNLHRRQLLDLAAFSDNQPGDLVGTLADTGGNFAQPARTLNGRQRFPAGLGALGGVNRQPCLFGSPVRDPRQQRFGRRVKHVDPAVAATGNELAINIHRVLNGCCHGCSCGAFVFNR